MGKGGSGGAGQGGSGGLNLGGSTSQGGLDPDASCASTSAEAELLPLDMIILLDRSGSMSEGNKWSGATGAISTFVNDMASAGINVGLDYFPKNDNGQDECDYSVYQQLAVPIGELPMNATAIAMSMQNTSPDGGTPMRSALQGTLSNATAYQDANPNHKVIVVLATDGDPSGCTGNTVSAIAGLAASALNYNGVQTYAIAVPGATLSNLNQIAAAGGTMQAYDSTSDISAFLSKMADIRASALACEFLIPTPPMGATLDKDKVAVKFVPGMGTGVEIPKADDAADCGAGPGWYYDDGMNPHKILLCPASCTTVQNDHQAKINVLFGCKPDVN